MNSRFFSSLLCVLVIVSCATQPDPETKPMGENVLTKEQIRAAKRGPVDFVTHVKPVLERKCVMCHNRKALPANGLTPMSRRLALVSDPQSRDAHGPDTYLTEACTRRRQRSSDYVRG